MVEEEIEEQEDYEVNIGSFNGPMDLLVYLVQKKEMALDQIPIAEIADDFAKWVEAYSAMDLSKAGDFLCMASRLMALKVQELLPADERDPETEAEYNEDREQLMKEMLEYQRFKQVAGGLQEMEGKNFGTYSRGRLEKMQNDDDTLADANIWQLFRAYQKSLKTKISETIHHIELDYVTIQDRQQAINNYLAVNGRALFEDLLDNDSHPIVAAVTFMAMLEMIKTDEIVFRQSELFGPIWIYRKKNNPDYAEEMAHETVFFSKDPDVKPGLVEALRSQALARSQQGTVGDIAAVMREAVLWTSRGKNVTEDDLTAMLEGREDISEVQENPFNDMEDGESGATPSAASATDAASTPAEQNSDNETASVEANEAANSTEQPSETATEVAPAAFTVNDFDETDDYTVTDEEAESDIAASGISDEEDDFEDDEFSDETGDEIGAEEIEDGYDDSRNNDVTEVESASEETVKKSPTEHTAETTITNPEEAASMNDAQFAEFMKKAQEYYSNAAAGAAFAAGTKAEEDETREETNTGDYSNDFARSSGISSYSSHNANTTDDWTKDLPDDWDAAISGKWSKDTSSSSDKAKADPTPSTSTSKAREEKNYTFGNEMTDDEYIAYLSRSAKKDNK